MSRLSEIADGLGVSEDVICIRTGRSRSEIKRVIEADSTIYPGELQGLMHQLMRMSHDILEADIEKASEDNKRRRQYLEAMAREYGIGLGQNEDPFDF